MKYATALAVLLLLGAFTALAADNALPPGEKAAKERLNTSARHGEWAEISVPGSDKKMKAYVVYPERKDKAPVVIVIQEIFGLSDWIRGVADQLAADGFIAIAPDLLAGQGENGGGSETFKDNDALRKATMNLKPDRVKAALDATREYGLKLPAANGKSACIGFCYGGMTSFRYATEQPDLNAAVVYYGTSPAAGYENIKAPVAAFYGGSDERVNATIKPAEEKTKAANKSYTPHVYEGAGHGFLRQQDGPKDAPGANMKAAEQAWPETLKFLRENTK